MFYSNVCYACKCLFRFKKPDERQILHNIMQVLLPQLYERFTFVIEDSSQASVEVQKQILKIYFALIQVSGIFWCLSYNWSNLHVWYPLE